MRALYRIADTIRHWRRLSHGSPAHAWGKRGEDLAHRFLQKKGYIIVGRNWRTLNRSAEADLIARDGETLVFIEVKTRATDRFGAPEDAVDSEKRRHIVRAAGDYLRHTGDAWETVRFDIVTVLFGAGIEIQHIRDAFTPPRTGVVK